MNRNPRVLVLPAGGPTRPSSRARVYSLVPSLRQRGLAVEVLDPTALPSRVGGTTKLYRLFMLRAALRADVVLIQKRLLDRVSLWLLRRTAKPLVFDYDDALHVGRERTSRSERLATRQRLDRCLRAARATIAGNEFLAAHARQHCRDVTVIPTVVDPRVYAMTPPPPVTDGLVVGWVGTPDNLDSLTPLRTVIRSLTRGGADRLRFRIVCSRPPDWADPPFEFEAWTLERAVDSIRDFHVGLMPLADTPWNRGKCGFKAIEYMALGRPVIASPVGMLADLVRDGETGLLARTESEWANAISSLLSDASLRSRLAESARRHVERNYSVEAAVPMLEATLRRAAASSH